MRVCDERSGMRGRGATTAGRRGELLLHAAWALCCAHAHRRYWLVGGAADHWPLRLLQMSVLAAGRRSGWRAGSVLA